MSNASDAIDLADRILEWAEDVPNFNIEFVESIKVFVEENDFASDDQVAALERIIISWNIE